MDSTSHDAFTPLDADECERLLREEYVGRLGYVLDRRPVIVPVNYRLDDEGTILVMTGPGAKLDAARAGAVLSLQIDGVDDVAHRGWSVLASGRADVVDGAAARAQAEAVHLRPWARGAPRTHLLRIHPHLVEGRSLG